MNSQYTQTQMDLRANKAEIRASDWPIPFPRACLGLCQWVNGPGFDDAGKSNLFFIVFLLKGVP